MAPGNDFEVVVIGGGVVGHAVALALARRGAVVALLEAEPELAKPRTAPGGAARLRTGPR